MNHRMYLAGGILLFCIGIPELVLRGLLETDPMSLAVGAAFVAAGALCLIQARSEKRQFDAAATTADEVSPADAAEAPQEPGRPQ